MFCLASSWQHRAASFAATAAIFLWAGCREPGPTPAAQVIGNVEHTLTVVPTTVGPGDSFRAILTLRNEASDTLRLVSGATCIAFLHVLKDATRLPMQGSDFGCAGMLQTFIIAPREALVQAYDLVAMLKSSSDSAYQYTVRPSAGVYRLRAELLVDGLADPEAAFTVQP